MERGISAQRRKNKKQLAGSINDGSKTANEIKGTLIRLWASIRKPHGFRFPNQPNKSALCIESTTRHSSTVIVQKSDFDTKGLT